MSFQSVKYKLFDRLAEVKEPIKTNNSNLSAYMGTVRFELCSKSKCIAQQSLFMGERIATASVPTGFAMTGIYKTFSIPILAF